MPEPPANADRPKQPPRPWYRLHLSTCIVLVPLTAVLVLLIVPGDIRDPHKDFDLSDWSSADWESSIDAYRPAAFEHGWPFTYLRRGFASPPRPEPTDIPWLDAESWLFSGDYTEFELGSLAIDILAAFECRRRRQQNVWQFRLWELLALFVFVAGVLGWWRMHQRRFHQELQAVSEMEYADVTPSSPPVLDDFPVRPSFGAFYRLHTAYCGPKWLKNLAPDRCAKVFRTAVSVELHVGSYPRRRGADLERLRENLDDLPNLQRVDLIVSGDSKLTDGGLVHLSGLTTLEFLCVRDVSLGNAGVKHLAGLKNLQRLDLSDTQVDDEGLKYLVGLEGLWYLALCNTPVSDAGIVHLRRLRNLEFLHLTGTQVTEQGIDKLREALPNCRVDWEQYEATPE